ncbi:GAF domain-containing sensor histidine kinase [Umezakia ovalisporum]|uniref:GAF domain-containing sensor histidine kinase n=1 Tax=Umezakia ovalisporum TaxID=75695 RepID=UPI0024766194|nr:ATP-binding protein [Umezakia ovalisporum]MBI1241353.1 GAF domain-containing protein [Nostoc sp. RI_552]MDH6084535.1 ATP-binding protein [Umezakia ovalisporum TAC611]MDH6088704.1 ATP-binding protein [Umezakia ovalisporum Ak1311]
MLISASSDFVALCREQIALLTEGLGASLSVVYLTQELVDAPAGETKLIPVVIYPETALLQPGKEVAEVRVGDVLVVPDQQSKLLQAGMGSRISSQDTKKANGQEPDLKEESEFSADQIVLPLIHEGVMMGLLVTGREDRAWNEQEQSEIQKIAQTLAIACILDQRRAWLQHQVHQHKILQEQQRDLLDNLLHQFRNPLTALRTLGKLLLKRLRQGDPNREVGANIVRESHRLEELLRQFDKVIDWAETDLGPLSLHENEVFVEATVEKEPKPALLLPGMGEKKTDCFVVDLLTPLLVSAKAIAQERHLQIKTEIHRNSPRVRVNIKALQEVFSNIIDNALKYTPEGGTIAIQAGQEKANYQGIAISNTGPGIPAEDLAHLGERHYRGVQAQTEIPGTGLGLAIAKQLVEQMQGEIEIFSPAINSAITAPHAPGTTFIIWLPMTNDQ